MNNFATVRPTPNSSLGRVHPETMDSPRREFPKIDRVVPILERHYTPTDEKRGWYLVPIGCVVHTKRWHCVYSAVGGGRDATGTVCRNSPLKTAIWLWAARVQQG
jgi:hypothetical protein